ncbi:MAG: reverse transcriptase domain-containing protein, partial [Aeromonas sp.]
AGIIEEATSPFNSPVVMVKKTNGKYRFCVDFRKLNDITINLAVHVPSVSEVFDQLQGSKIFTVLDLRSGYWQVPIREEDRDKTAFTVANKQYRFRRMPFGLSGAPFTFRKLMVRLLNELENVAVYGDDIVIFSDSVQDHRRHLESVLRRISEAGLRINGGKSQVNKETVTLLGHIVGRGEIRPLPEKLTQIGNAEPPKSKRELRKFLGQAGFYSKFVPDFNSKAAPLFEILRKDNIFKWTDETQQAFKILQAETSGNHPTLRLPKLNGEFTVTTDASDRGIGAVLQQEGKPVEYASRVLTSAEQKYSTTEKECLAIVWALEKWRPYLLGRKFHVKTDHKPLEWLKTARDPRGKLARWTLKLQEYDFSIGYIPGSQNHMADYLSRISDEDHLPSLAYGANALTVAFEHDPSQLVEAQEEDRLISQIKRALLAGDQLPQTVMEPGHHVYRAKWSDLNLSANGLVMIRVNERSVPVIPTSRQGGLISQAHEMAHTGCQRTISMLKQRAFWPRMVEDIKQFVLSCTRCQVVKGTSTSNNLPIQPIPVTTFGEIWSVDVMGPFPATVCGEQYVLVMTEHLTRWIEVAAITDQRALTVCRAIMDHIIADHGVPQKILTDQGPCFESDEFRRRLMELGIKKVRTTPYHPQGNGLTERNNRTLKEWLAAKGESWRESLPWVILGHRATPQRAIRRSPFELLYGRKARLPVDTGIGVWYDGQVTFEELSAERAIASEELQRTQRNALEHSQSTNVERWREYNIGDQVKWRCPNFKNAQDQGSRKLKPKWRGPFKVIQRRGSVYTIRNAQEERKVHGSQLRRWYIRKSPEEG